MMSSTQERYGDYELVQYLTAGGMADLFLARSPQLGDTKSDRTLVLKRIQPRYAEMTRVVKMFIDEGRIAQALEHPNIVKVVDVGHQSGTYFIAMEYIAGRDLLAICRRGTNAGNFFSRPLAVALLGQVARGLMYAHEKRDSEGRPLKVVHCDLSPGNIVVSWGGTAKIVDFGIARAEIQLRTEDHSVAGKFNYMAPEQIRGEPIDSRADLFAFGILLYELTVGKRLFRGRPEQVMQRVLEEKIVRPCKINPAFPADLEAIILRTLERDREARYQTARSLRNDLLGWLATQAPHGKAEIAAYLRAIFGTESAPLHEAQDFASRGEDFSLEAPLPLLDSTPLAVDAEEPEGLEMVAEVPLYSVAPSVIPALDPTDKTHATRSARPERSIAESKGQTAAIIFAALLFTAALGGLVWILLR